MHCEKVREYILYSSEAIRINFKLIYHNIKFRYQEFVVQNNKIFATRNYPYDLLSIAGYCHYYKRVFRYLKKALLKTRVFKSELYFNII